MRLSTRHISNSSSGHFDHPVFLLERRRKKKDSNANSVKMHFNNFDNHHFDVSQKRRLIPLYSNPDKKIRIHFFKFIVINSVSHRDVISVVLCSKSDLKKKCIM